MNDKSNKKGAGQQKGKPAVSQQTRDTVRTTTSSTSSSGKAPAASAAARNTSNTKTTTTTSQRGSSGSGGGSGHVVREEKSSGGWLAPVALLFGLVGTLLSGFLWSKLNSFSSSTTTALVSQKEETATMVADTKTELTAALDEKTGALESSMQAQATAMEEQAAANEEKFANTDQKVSEQLASFSEEVTAETEASQQEVATSTAQSLQDFTTKSEGELNAISTSFNVGIRSLREDMETRFQENETQAGQMQETLQSTNELANRGQRDWILAEVEYLLRTGHHRVKLAGDVKAGVLALESANDRLHALGDIDYFPVREQIEREVTELRRLGPPNIEGLIFRLETASKVADTLPLQATEEEEAGDSDASGESGEAQSGGSAVGNLLKSMNFSVSSTDKSSIDSRLAKQAAGGSSNNSPTKQQIGASEALSTHLQAARLSALRADSERFTYHMDNSIKYTGEVFDSEQDSVKEFVANLEEIRQTNIVPNVPILGSALSIFEKIDAKRSEK